MSCPDHQQLQQLLDESLPADQAAPLQAHVDTCAACQKQIERLAAGGVTWDKTAQHLAESPRSDETAFLEAIDKLQNDPTSALQTQAEAAKPYDEDLSFLSPSQKPGSLGRLDEFEILSIVGKGGFGIVLKAFDENLHRIVAIKVMLPHLAANGTARERFIREAKAAAAMTHENIVTIHAVKKEAKNPYLVMQFVSGVTLNDKIDKNGPLPVKEILRIGVQIAEGLAAAHKNGLIHRDIKPGNILLENGVERVKITDFGLARTTDDASVTQSGTVAGTPMYMSPEQANGESVDPRSDLFSLGSVLYVMATGRPPFRATSTMAVMKRVCEDTPTPVQQVNPDIPAWLGAIIARLHAKNPADRYQSAHDVAELLGQRLADVQAGRAIETQVVERRADTDVVEPTPRQRRWNPYLIAVAVAVAAMAGTMRWLQIENSAIYLMGALSYGGLCLITIGVAPLYRRNRFFLAQAGLFAFVAIGCGIFYFGQHDQPTPPPLMAAHEVLDRLVGTWSVQAEMTDPKQDAVRGKVHFNWIANKKFLRAYAVMDSGGESLTIFSFDDRTKTFRRWFFASDAAPASIQGPHVGHWDMSTAVLTSEGELPFFHKIRLEDHWAGVDDFETRSVVTDNLGNEVAQHIKKMHRIGTENVVPKLPPSPKRAPAIALMDRQIGTWLTKADVTLAELGGKTVQSESTTRDVAILGGRFIESHEITPRSNRDDYIIVGYDENRKTHRFWHFSPSGEVMEADGIWNKDENKVTWKSLDGRISGDWIFPNENERHVKMAAKDAQGRRLYEVNAVARREGAPEPGFVQLFNGKNFGGWITPEPGPDVPEWSIGPDTGLWVSGAGKKASYLVTERSEFTDFHLRAEIAVYDMTDASIHFRAAPQAEPGKFPIGYEAFVGDQPYFKTGTLRLTTADSEKPGVLFKVAENTVPINYFVKIDPKSPVYTLTGAKHFRMEIIARGKHVVIKIDDKIVADFEDASGARFQGAIALRVFNGCVNFKKIEIKEFPPSEPGWVHLFNGKDVAGWKGDPQKYLVENGHLVVPPMLSAVDMFWTGRTYKNYELRFQYRIPRPADDPRQVWAYLRLHSTAPGPSPDFKACASVMLYAHSEPGLATEGEAKHELPPQNLKDSTPGEWQSIRVVCRDQKIAVYFNGQQAYALSGCKPSSGHIGLWAIGREAHFRNIEIKELPPSEPWGQLFNGKDMTGLTVSSFTGGDWSVKDGILTGKVDGKLKSCLLAPRNDYLNFHALIEMKMTGNGAAAGLVFQGESPNLTQNFAEVNFKEKHERTIGLHTRHAKDNSSRFAAPPGELPHDTWFTLEVIAAYPKVIYRINGVTVIERDDVRFERGHLALCVASLYTTLSVRKFEIRENPKLPPEEPRWVQLFDGKDLTGWEEAYGVLSQPPKTKIAKTQRWQVKDKILILANPTANHNLRTAKAYTNYELEMEYRAAQASDETRVALVLHQGDQGGEGYRLRISKGIGSFDHFLGSMYTDVQRFPRTLPEREWNRLTIVSRNMDYPLGGAVVPGSLIEWYVNGEKLGSVKTSTVGGRILLDGELSLPQIQLRGIRIRSLQTGAEPGWMQLFDGKDLANWNLGKEKSGDWKVENKTLIGKGHQAWLLSDRTDFKDFHLRMEAKYVNGVAQLVLRGGDERSAKGYWVNMTNDKGNMHTGAITTSLDFKAHTTIVREERTKPNEWFTLEVIARGRHFQTFVNGEQALDWTDPFTNNVTQGTFRLYTLGKDAELHVRKFEIKELPTRPPSPPTVAERGVLDFAEIHGVDTERFDAWIAQMKKDGFRPVRLSVHSPDRSPRYSAIAIKEAKPLEWDFSRAVGATAEIEKQLAPYWARQLRIVDQCAYNDAGVLGLALLGVKDGQTSQLWTSDEKGIAERIADGAKSGKRPISFGAIANTKGLRFVVALADADKATALYTTNVTLDQLESWVEKHKAAGYRLDHLHAYSTTGANTRFGAIMVKDAQALDWEVSWKLTPAHYDQQIEERRRQGFRPLYALQHDDNTGALRVYSVIWVRYRVA